MNDKLKILVVAANEGGCAYYRALLPFRKLQQHCSDEVEVKFNSNPINWDTSSNSTSGEYPDLEWCDIMMTQNISNFGPTFMIELFKASREAGKFIHYDTDDLLTELYPGHRLYQVYKDRDLSELTKSLYHNADLVTVTQKKFANRI